MTITVHDGNGRNPTQLTKARYDDLVKSGMMWEFHPDAPERWPYPSMTPSATPPLVIALSGNRGVGKDTLFTHLKTLRPQAQRFAFADALKADLVPLLGGQFGIDPRTATGAAKEFVRPMLIAYGCAWREKDPEHWVKVVVDQIRVWRRITEEGFLPVVVDVRFPNEIALLREAFGKTLFHVDVTRRDAPPPTSEEEKHYRAVRDAAEYQLVWGGNIPAEQEEWARQVLCDADNR